MNIGKLGVWYFTDVLSATDAAEFARTVESLGYGALWYPEAGGRNSMAHGSWLLSQTTKLVVATGIANIYARDAQATQAAWQALDEQSDGRFLLGLGVSHAPLVESLRGHNYTKPLTFMREYLEKMEQATYQAPAPTQRGELVLAALGPKMLELSGQKTDGAHPYNVTPEHTARARKILGPDKKLYVEQKVCLEIDPERARAVARSILSMYLPLPNYRNAWFGMGFTEADVDGTSDRFLDAMVAWGEESAIADKIQAHLEAGADHVCIQPLGAENRPEMKVLEAMAKRFN